MSVAKFKLILYVQAGNSGQALSRLYQAMENHNYSDYELAIIDVTQQPKRAVESGITKTPTLVCETGDGGSIVSDDLSDIEKLRHTFGFKDHK